MKNPAIFLFLNKPRLLGYFTLKPAGLRRCGLPVITAYKIACAETTAYTRETTRKWEIIKALYPLRRKALRDEKGRRSAYGGLTNWYPQGQAGGCGLIRRIW